MVVLQISFGQMVSLSWITNALVMLYVIKIEMPFAPIIGTNHHKQTIIFGFSKPL